MLDGRTLVHCTGMMQHPTGTQHPTESNHRRAGAPGPPVIRNERTEPTTRKRRRPSKPLLPLGPGEADRDILDQYLYEVSVTPLLKPPEEIALAKRGRAGDQA